MLNMKSFVTALIVASSLLTATLAEAAYRANYEATLLNQEGSRVIRTAELASSGRPLAQALEQYQLTLVPTISPDGTYHLAISLASADGTAGGLDQGTGRTYPGKVGTPLEVETSIDGVAISVAFMLYEARE